MRPLLSAHQLALAPVLFVFTCFIFRLVSAFASEAASASAPASARVGSQPSSPRAFAFSASVARVPCGLYFALLASGPAGGQPQFTFNSNGAAFNDAAAADNTSAARVHQACDLLCDAISTQQWAAHAKIESFCALLCAAFTSHQMSELASGADGAPAAVLSIEWPPLVSVDDAFAQCERVFAAAPAPTPSFALPSAALILNASYHFCRTLSYSGISASPALADRCSDALLEHHPNSAAVLLLPRSLEPRWSAEAYRLMEERSRALTNRDEAAVESISDDATPNSSNSSRHRTVAAELHALNRDLISAATLLNVPVTFDFPTPSSSASSSPSVPASSNDPSDDPHAARQRLIDEQARRLRRLVAALFPDAADFVVAVRDPFDFDAVAAHAKLRLEAAYRHSIELSEAACPALALPIAAHWLGMDVGLPAKRISPTAVNTGVDGEEAVDDGGILPAFFYATYRSAQELVHVPVLERLDRFGEFIVLAHTADRDVYYHPFHALAWPFLRAPTAYRLIAHVGEKYARECAFRPTLAALPKAADDNANLNADGSSGSDESGDSGSGDDGGSDIWMRPAFHRSIVDTLVSLPADASHMAVPDGTVTDHHPGHLLRSATSTGSTASSTASASASTSATTSSASASASATPSSAASASPPLAARLRVGYLSADLHVSHPVGVLAHSLFALHDRARFEVHCLSLRRVPRDPFQRAWGADDREDADERAKHDANGSGSGSDGGSGKRAATDTGSIESSQCTAPHATNHSSDSSSPSSDTAQPTVQPCDLRCEHWHSLDALDAAELFALLHTRLRLHIIVDIIGYCLHHRASVLCGRPAPLQFNFLGFSATQGAAYQQYIIVDSHIAPTQSAPNWDPESSNPDASPSSSTVAHSLYSERLIRMPHSYMFASHAHIGAFANVVRSLRGLHRAAYAEGRAVAAARRHRCLDGAGSDDGGSDNDTDGNHNGNIGQNIAGDASRDAGSGNRDDDGASGNHDDNDDDNRDHHLGHHRLRLAQLRRALSMPYRGVLLVAFAGSYKLPPMLPIWLRMLSKHANAVLILRAPPATKHHSSSLSSVSSSSASHSADSNAGSPASDHLNSTDEEKARANDAHLSRSARENILALAAAANVSWVKVSEM